MSDDIDIEPTGDSLDGAVPKDPDDAADGAGEALKAKRPKSPRHQGRRGRRRDVEDPGTSR
jgi:hypothetical protein